MIVGPYLTERLPTAGRRLDLVDCVGTVTINGELVGTLASNRSLLVNYGPVCDRLPVVAGEGKGGDVMGHPLEPLAWLANHLTAASTRTIRRRL